MEAGGKVIGVTVVKLNLEWFQRAGGGSAEPLMVSDDHGVIFLSSVPAWQYRTLGPLPASLHDELGKTRQYHDRDVTPLPLEPLTSPVTDWLAATALDPAPAWCACAPTAPTRTAPSAPTATSNSSARSARRAGPCRSWRR